MEYTRSAIGRVICRARRTSPAAHPSIERPSTDISEADIREIVRRTVLASGSATQAGLIATVQSGRFKPQLPQRHYL